MKIKNIEREGAWQVPKLLNHYRYRLGFLVNSKSHGRILFICLNPSTASLTTSDPTVDVFCRGFAVHNGFRELEVANIFGYRSTNKQALCSVNDPVGPENDHNIKKTVREADKVVIAWGKYFHDKIRSRAIEVLKIIRGNAKLPIYMIGQNKDYSPKHPIFQKAHGRLIPITKDSIDKYIL
jgi:hypothetical protein